MFRMAETKVASMESRDARHYVSLVSATAMAASG